MKKLLLPIFVTALIITSCSTAPDVVRDNLYDSDANVPNGEIIFPRVDNKRGEIEYLSFKIKLNKAAINHNVHLSLESDVDGLIYETPNATSDTLIVNKTKLSKGKHTAKLFLNGKKVSETIIYVMLPNNVNLEVEEKKGVFNLKWTKYIGDDFKSYRIYASYYRPNSYPWFFENEIAEITAESDTSYEILDFPYQEHFMFYIKVEEHSNQYTNTSNIINIQLPAIDRMTSNYLNLSTRLGKLFYMNGGLNIYDFNNNTTDDMFFSITSDNLLGLYVNDIKQEPELVIAKNDRFERYNLKTGHLLNSFAYDQNSQQSQFIYDSYNDQYFVSKGKKPFNLNWDTETLNPIPDYQYSFDRVTIVPDRGTMFARPNTMIKYGAHGEFKNIEEINFTSYDELRFKSSNYHVMLNATSSPVIISVDPIQEQFQLEATGVRYNSFYQSQLNSDYLIAGTFNGIVQIYSLSKKSLVFSYKLDYKIISFIEIDDNLLALIGRAEQNFTTVFHLRKIPFDLK